MFAALTNPDDPLSLTMLTDTVTMNGHTFTSNNVFIGNLAGQSALSLVLTNGTYLLNNSAGFAGATSAGFGLTLDNATFTSNNFTDMATGSLSNVLVTIRNGSHYSAAGSSGSFIGDTGTAVVGVDGVGSSFSLGINSRLGSSSGSSGTVNVTNGGAFRTMGNFSVATGSGTSGTVNVSNAGSS